MYTYRGCEWHLLEQPGLRPLATGRKGIVTDRNWLPKILVDLQRTLEMVKKSSFLMSWKQTGSKSRQKTREIWVSRLRDVAHAQSYTTWWLLRRKRRKNRYRKSHFANLHIKLQFVIVLIRSACSRPGMMQHDLFWLSFEQKRFAPWKVCFSCRHRRPLSFVFVVVVVVVGCRWWSLSFFAFFFSLYNYQ